MLINLTSLCSKYRFIPKGVIHIGAHTGEEKQSYDEIGINNVIWIEANPKLSENLSKKINDTVINATISNVNDKKVTFNVTNNFQSSSILPLKKHSEFYPKITVSERIELKTKTMDTLILENEIDMLKFDFLNIDIQGAELLALQGMKDNLKYIKYIYTEVNFSELYEGCCLMNEIDDYLIHYNFRRVELSKTPCDWGDAFYIKK